MEFIRELGSGAFGQVWLAHARGIAALNPHDKSAMATRRRTKLRLNSKVPKSLLNCFLPDNLCDENVFVAVKTLKGEALLQYCIFLAFCFVWKAVLVIL